MTPTPDFKVTLFFDAKHLRNGTRCIVTYALLSRVTLSKYSVTQNIAWSSITANTTESRYNLLQQQRIAASSRKTDDEAEIERVTATYGLRKRCYMWSSSHRRALNAVLFGFSGNQHRLLAMCHGTVAVRRRPRDC